MTINIRIRDGLCPDPSTGDGGATEGDIRGAISDIIDTVGVKDLAGGHCLVTENSPAAMSVLVAPGVVYIPNANYDELDSNTVKFWEAIITVSTAVTITANTSGSTRIDLICVKMDTTVTPDEHASNIATLVAVAGTPGAGVPATPDNYAKLAEVEVASGASTIVNANITSTRVQSKIDSDYIPLALPSGITLTSPKINEDVALTATATELNNLHSKTVGLGAWTAWNPTTANITTTSGTFNCAYIQIGKTVHCRFKFTLGASSAMGTLPIIELPVTNKSGAAIMVPVLIHDAGNTYYTGFAINDQGESKLAIYMNKADGSYTEFTNITATVPMTWAENDKIWFYCTYEAA